MSDKNTPLTKRCAKCGACTVVCPVYRASRNEIYSARGKRHLADVFKGQKSSPVFEDIYSKCLLCGACAAICPQQLDITGDIVDARSEFSPLYGEYGYLKFIARQALNRPEVLGAARVLGRQAAGILFGRLPADSGLRLRLAMFHDQPQIAKPDNIELPRPVPASASGSITYFPGCTARYLYPEIEGELNQLLAGYGVTLNRPDGLACCGMAFLAAGHRREALRAARTNIAVLEQSDGPILVSCGSCFAQLAGYVDLFEDDPAWATRARLVSERVVEVSVFIDQLVEGRVESPVGNQSTLRVFYHDPCHLRHDARITAEPRDVLRRLPGVELLELPDGPQCCGQGGLFHLGAPELSATIRDDLAGKILALDPDVITTTCSGCLMQLRMAMAAAGREVPVVHFGALVRQRLQSAQVR